MGDARESPEKDLELIRHWLRCPPKTWAGNMAFHGLKRMYGFSPPPRSRQDDSGREDRS